MEKNLKEKQFHNKLYEDSNDEDWNRNVVGKFYSIADKAYDFLRWYVYSNCQGKKVLEYGCGTGEETIVVSTKGAYSLTGIDISDSAILKAQRIAQEYDKNVDFRVMNAEQMDFLDNEFDLIFGSGILHHLDLKKAFSEIARVLNYQGQAIFLEPLGHNLLINIYRKRTPHLRTDDEHPLLIKDIKLAKNYFSKVECHYFFFFST